METTEIHELAKELPTNKRDEFIAKLKCIRRFLAEEKSLIWYTVEWMRYNTERSTLSVQKMNIPQYMLSDAKCSIEFGLPIALHPLFYSPITTSIETVMRFDGMRGRLNQLYHYKYENTASKNKRRRNVTVTNKKR